MGISQCDYRESFASLNKADFTGPLAAFTSANSILRWGGKFLGQAIWLPATRYDSTSLLTQCATLLRRALNDVDKLNLFLAYARQINTLIMSADFALWFHPFPAQILSAHPLQIIALPDAGFGSLGKMSSLESGLI